MKIEIRPTRVTDAKRFYEILTDKEYTAYADLVGMNTIVTSIAGERKFLMQSEINRKKRFACGYAILADKKVVGAIGIKINQHRKYIGEVGYFLDKNEWGKGITLEALKQINEKGFNEFGLKRLELVINPINKRSIRVAEKGGYKYEGTMKNAILGSDGKLRDGKLFSMVNS